MGDYEGRANLYWLMDVKVQLFALRWLYSGRTRFLVYKLLFFYNFLTARAPGKWPVFRPNPRPNGPIFGPRGRPPGIARFAHHFPINLDELFLAA